MAGSNPEKTFENYQFVSPPINKPYLFPQAPTHNPDPNYRATLLKVLNETKEEGVQIQKCLAESKAAQLLKLTELLQLNKQAKDLLIKDGFTGFAGGRRKQQTSRRKHRTHRRTYRRTRKN